MKKIRILAYICLMVLLAMPFFGAQYKPIASYASILLNDSIVEVKTDSLQLVDSAAANKLLIDTVPKNNALDAIVDYKSSDSIVMTKDKWAYLYGDAHIDYTDIKLTGEIVSMNMDSSIVEAKYGIDSIGEEFGYPIFTDKGTEYETKTMKYNFKTKRGFSQHLVTEQGEGYVVAGIARKNEDNSFFMREGMYTTCDEHDHPHFYLALTKAKVQPKKNVVTGPAYLVIEGLHIPFIGLPFGFFPFTDSYSSGVIMPTYGDEMERGFNLRDGGYYFAINDHVDLKLLGTIYTKGSWALSAQSTYRKRYKYSGNVNIGYQFTKIGDKEVPSTYSVSKDLRINWTHSQDPKANMFRTLSANVDFSTQSYDRHNLDGQFTPRSTTNTKSSSVNFTQRFPNSPWSISGSMNVSQRSEDKTVNATLPNITVSMSRIYPFKRKEAVGAEKWFEKIQMSYSGDFRNSIQTTEDDLSLSFRNWNTAMKHHIPVSATFNLFNHLNITPSISYTERWYTKRQKQTYMGSSTVMEPKENKLKRVFDFNASLGFQTKLYGMYKPLFAKQVQIRHVLTPSVSLSYAPDFKDPRWGYYDTFYRYDANGELIEDSYSPYASEMFGVPGGPQGSINFSFQNNLEMKLPSESDSTGYKKISLIDNLGIDFNYNMQAKEFKWSDPRVNLRLKLSKSLTVNLNATFDPYTYDFVDTDVSHPGQLRLERVDKLRISEKGRGFMRLVGTSYSISPSINQDTFKKWFGGSEIKKEGSDPESEDGQEGATEERKGRLLGGHKEADGEYDSDGYLKNEVRWSLGFSLSMNYGYDRTRIDIEKKEFKYKLTKSLSFNGSIQPTKNWSLNFSASYDFDLKRIPHMTCNITRNLHCWSISGSITPLGMYKSYYVSLRANSSLLQDLKHEFKGRTSSYDPNWD